MSFVATLFQPFLAFLGTYKWYILIFILLYLALTIVFRHSRELITVVFGTLIIIFVITHLGDVYVMLNHLMTQVGENSQVASEQYAEYVGDNIIDDDNADAVEKLQRALNYGILGRETLDGGNGLPTSDDASLSETIDYVANTKNDGNDEGSAKKLLDAAGNFVWEIFNELKALFGFDG